MKALRITPVLRACVCMRARYVSNAAAFRRVQEWASRIALRLPSRAFSSPAFSRADRRLARPCPKLPTLKGMNPCSPPKSRAASAP